MIKKILAALVLLPIFIVLFSRSTANESFAFDTPAQTSEMPSPLSPSATPEGVNPARGPIENREERIVGGQEADPGEYPWQVSLLYEGQSVCGGTLIDPQWVLTVAHCLVEPDGSTTPAEKIEVLLGEHDLSKNDGTEQQIAISEVINHEQYGLVAGSYDYDIGLLKLKTPATIIEGQVESIALNTHMDIPVHAPAVVTGWGVTSSGGTAPFILHEVTVPIVSNQTCRESYKDVFTENMICAGYEEGGKDACQGDSGGPLVLQDANNNWLHVGIVSFGEGCAAPNFYGVYARTSKFIDWIESKTGITIADTPNPINTPLPTATPDPNATATPVPSPTDQPNTYPHAATDR